jgi:hypothetical protein
MSPLLIPGPAQDGERVAEVLHRPSRAFDLLQPGVGEEAMNRLSGD